ncbi:MAG: arylsulfatase [Pirellulaceae bacterium]
MNLPTLAALAACLLPASCPAQAATPKTNIIYIVVDDLGYGDLGCYGQQVIATPNLDRLAKEGLRFTDHYAGATVCRPSRLVYLTGYHTGHTAISANTGYVLKPDDVTVAELLKQAGYATGGVGKWALGGPGSSGHPNRQGFDFWYGYLDQGEAHNYYPEVLYRNEKPERLPGNKLGQRRVSEVRETYSHDLFTDEALAFIERNHDKPFFLNIAYTIPHANNEGGRATGNGMEVPDFGMYADKDWPETEKGQAAMITRMDRDIGRLTALLQKLDIADRTLVLFTSDNGPHSEGGHKHEYFDANGPLRGFKRDLYEGGVRVPLIAWWPGVVTPGVSHHMSGFWDLLPTACELAGVDAPRGIDGVSFVPTLRGQQQKAHDYLFWKYGDDKTAVRQGRWKAVRPAAQKPLELYDLETDLGEEDNLAAQHPEIVKRLEKLIAEAQR